MVNEIDRTCKDRVCDRELRDTAVSCAMALDSSPPRIFVPRRKWDSVIEWTWFSSVVLLSVICSSSAMSYTAPDDCEWTPVNANDVSVTCRLQTVVSSGLLVTNFSLIQTEHTDSLTIFCDQVFFESDLGSATVAHLRFLKSLRFQHCKFRSIPQEAFRGLIELRNLSIRTYNSEWGAYPLTLHSSSFAGLRSLEVLDLGYNKIMKIGKDTICELNSLKVLNLTHNDLREVINGDYVGPYSECLNELLELDLSFNKISTIDKRVVENFQRLRSLNLKNNFISFVDSSSLSRFSKLQVLDLSNNYLESVSSMLLQDSPDLRELYLQNNSLTGIPVGFLTGLQQLLILNMSFNQITSESIGADTFIDLIRLVILELSHNNLQYMNSSIFQSQYSLQMLFLSHNDISMIADNSFSSLYNLHTLDLSNNDLKYMDIFTLNGLYVINSLSLAYNNIYNIHPDSFKNCSSVQDLSLKGNKLNHVPIALRSLQFLKSLNLANNSIEVLSNVSFTDLKQLNFLNLARNHLTALTRGAIPHLPSLDTLVLSKNRIKTIEHGIFEDAEGIKKLDLSSNDMTDINGLFMNLKTLKHLNVSCNNITWFDYALIPTDLELLDIHSNSIETLGNYYELEATLELRSLDVSYNKIKELNGAAFPNRISYANFSHNFISVIHPFTFMAKANLTVVDLAHNDLKNLEINTFRLNHLALRNPLPDFYLAGNPYFCDCSMEWMKHMNKAVDGVSQYPRVADMDEVMCQLSFTRHHSYLPIEKSDTSDFLCKYRSHCFALCHCCEFDACDCEMVCPENCTCFSDQTWNTNIVDCSERGFSSMPAVIPMDVTDLYLDGNNILQLSSHTFIGRKNMRIIYLNNSNIHGINNRTFNGLLTLRILHLENNKLVILHGYEFETLIYLKELYLSNNNIGFIANTTFQNLKSLEILYLDHNYIVEFQVWNLNWNSHLVEVHLGHNPYTCNCQYLESYRDWLNSVSTIVRDTGAIRCRQNRSAGPYLLESNLSLCSNVSDNTYFQAVFQADYMPITIIAASVTLIFVVLILVCIYRRDLKVWLYSKFGLRIFEKNHFTPEAEKLFDAFVSYSKKDEAFVSQFLAPELECGAPSYRLCLRYRDLPMSGYVAEAITEAIECSHRTIIVLSEQFLRNDWCRFELKSAHRESQINRKHKLIVVVLDKMSFKIMDPDAKMCFRTAPVIRWGDKRFWDKLRFSMPHGQGQNTIDPRIKFPHQRFPHSNSVKLV